jgi:hypothetical protein
MYTASLVENDIEVGKDLLEALRASGLPVSGAIWRYTAEIDQWYLTIGMPLVEQKGARAAYTALWSASERSGLLDAALGRRISLVSPKEPVIRGIRKNFGASRSKGAPVVHVTSGWVGDVFVENAYVYLLNGTKS